MIVSNSTPLINFAAIGRLDILEALFTKLTIPPAVEHELLERGAYPARGPHLGVLTPRSRGAPSIAPARIRAALNPRFSSGAPWASCETPTSDDVGFESA